MVKVWNLLDDQDTGKRNVSLVTSRDLGIVRLPFLVLTLTLQKNADMRSCFKKGKVFSTTWSPDDPLTLAAAGSKAKLQIWDVGANFGVRKAFGNKLYEAGKVLKEKENNEGGGVIGVESDDEESVEDDDD